jgi:hypothetical protein
LAGNPQGSRQAGRRAYVGQQQARTERGVEHQKERRDFVRPASPLPDRPDASFSLDDPSATVPKEVGDCAAGKADRRPGRGEKIHDQQVSATTLGRSHPIKRALEGSAAAQTHVFRMMTVIPLALWSSRVAPLETV